jgi:hypothetical protein
VALCRSCHTVIPCHCHLAPPVQIRPSVYLAGGAQPGDDAETQPIPDDIACEICEASNSGVPASWPEYEDRDGDVWFLTGETHGGDRVMMPSPSDVPLMLRRDVERLYGPLVPKSS